MLDTHRLYDASRVAPRLAPCRVSLNDTAIVNLRKKTIQLAAETSGGARRPLNIRLITFGKLAAKADGFNLMFRK